MYAKRLIGHVSRSGKDSNEETYHAQRIASTHFAKAEKMYALAILVSDTTYQAVADADERRHPAERKLGPSENRVRVLVP